MSKEPQLADYTFRPWRVQGDQRIVASEAEWRKPLKWDQGRVLVGVDVFEDWQGKMMDSQGLKLWIKGDRIESQIMKGRSDFLFLSEGYRPLTMADIRRRLFHLIDQTPNLDWILTTKHQERILDCTLEVQHPNWWYKSLGGYPGNVWLGVHVENQEQADKRIPELLRIPAAVRFVDISPMTGPVDFSNASHRHDWKQRLGKNALEGIHWVICGGGEQPLHPDWVRDLRDQCLAAGVPFWFRGWGEWREPLEDETYDTSMGRAQAVPSFIVAVDGIVHCFDNEYTDGGTAMVLVGKSAAGRVLDGKTWEQLPEV
jgi:protein gp37